MFEVGDVVRVDDTFFDGEGVVTGIYFDKSLVEIRFNYGTFCFLKESVINTKPPKLEDIL